MTKNSYHIGLIKGSGRCKCWSNGHRKNTVVVELARSVDYLSCELWRYMGERITTKEKIKKNKMIFLAWINKEFKQNFNHIIIE
jgi:hypothetical protein